MYCKHLQVLSGKPYRRSADVWALGCIVYELLTLKRAFDASNLGAMYGKIVEYEHRATVKHDEIAEGPASLQF
jgi:serine/threonine protein kinase